MHSEKVLPMNAVKKLSIGKIRNNHVFFRPPPNLSSNFRNN